MNKDQFNFTEVDASPERRIVTNLITRTEFIREYTATSFHFETQVAGLIANWALEYFLEFNEAPKQYIERIFLEKKETLRPEIAETAGRFLKSLSDEAPDDVNMEFRMYRRCAGSCQCCSGIVCQNLRVC